MLKNIKHTALLSIAIVYVLQLCFIFSGTLIENIQKLRQQNQITKILLAEHKEIPLKEWQQLDNTGEITIDKTFYDVISFKIISKKVILKAVKDDFEREIRISLQDLFNKKKGPYSGKKKSFNPYNYLTIITHKSADFFTRLPIPLLKPSLSYFQGKTNKIIEFIYRPPC